MAVKAGTKAIRVHITGQVQAVWFRAWTQEQASQRGLSGWVRNRADGSVEALFIGPDAAVAGMVAACWDGPPHAAVTGVEEFPAEDDGRVGFRYRPTM
ncbi:MAG: acylphosphatase [Proteobacteria bacterium]|nr:acylphosphatase [Pseudomonadota bacterium]